MPNLIKTLMKKGVMAVSMTLFFCCEDNTSTLNQINRFNENPVGTAYDIRMTYTDSARIKAILTAPLHLDYTHLSFKYSEFPEGLKIIFYNDKNEENTVVADYGILYNQTKIVDLQGNVVLLSNDGSRLDTDQMYWDSEKEWLFTERPFTFENEDYNLAATRLDANKEFSKFKSGKLSGTIAVEEQKDSLKLDEKL
jgi:LPS export ABC transporter protein LptC